MLGAKVQQSLSVERLYWFTTNILLLRSAQVGNKPLLYLPIGEP